MREKQVLRIKIDEEVDKFKQMQYNGYNDYFNFGLNTTTWRLFVNKQMLMRFERMFIERQLNDVAVEKRNIDSEI